MLENQKRELQRPGCRQEDNIQITSKKKGLRMWTEFIWLRIWVQ
jgi:hypothetical protein